MGLAFMVISSAGCGAAGRPSPPRRSALAAAPPPPPAVPVAPVVGSTLPILGTQLTGLPATLGSWTLIDRTEVPGAFSDQGLATVSKPAGGTAIFYTGSATVGPGLQAEGWNHVGDPDGWNGWLVTPFQGGPGSRSKMFQAESPDGAVITAVHPLVGGEMANNSFAAVTPDGQWTVSAEWGAEQRLLVFPTPMVNRSYAAGQPLPLAATVHLDKEVSDLQGCAFATATTLLCSDSSDLLRIDLNRPVQPDSLLAGSVSTVGALPEVGGCSGPYESEGVDVDRPLGQLRLEMSQPGVCHLATQVYAYRWAG